MKRSEVSFQRFGRTLQFYSCKPLPGPEQGLGCNKIHYKQRGSNLLLKAFKNKTFDTCLEFLEGALLIFKFYFYLFFNEFYWYVGAYYEPDILCLWFISKFSHLLEKCKKFPFGIVFLIGTDIGLSKVEGKPDVFLEPLACPVRK